MRCTIVAAPYEPSHERERGRDDDGHEPRKVTSDPQLARLFRRRAGHEPRIAIVVHGADVDTRSRIAALYSSIARATRSGASCPTQRRTIAPTSAAESCCPALMFARMHAAMFAAAAVASFAARVRCCGVQLASASTSKKARW